MRHAIRAFGWQRIAHGFVLTAPGPPTRADWLNVGLELAAPTGAISGWDALRIVGLGDARPPRQEALVLTTGGEHRVVGDVRIRPTRRPFRTWTLPGEHPDFPYADVAHTARAVADTALQYRRLAPVRALVTGAVQARRCTVVELLAEVDAGPRNDSAMLRRAVADLRDGARSVAEAEAIDVLRRCSLPEFEANVPIMTPSGLLLAVADGLWRELRAVLEIDSRAFHFSEDDWDKTRKRHSRLGRHGLSVDHHAPAEVRGDPALFAKQVEQWLRSRAAELHVAYRPVRDPLRPPADPDNPAPFIVPDLLP